MWFPLGFGDPAWEFGTLSQTFTSLPPTAFGLVLVAYAFVSHPALGAGWARVAAVIFALGAIVLAVMGFLFLTVIPEVMRQTPPEGAEAVIRVVIINGVEVVLYPVVFAAISVLLWRGVEKHS